MNIKNAQSSKSIKQLPPTINVSTMQSNNAVLAHTSIPVLEQELRALKQQEKKYNKLTGKLKQIEQQFQDVTHQQQIDEFTVQTELEQI